MFAGLIVPLVSSVSQAFIFSSITAAARMHSRAHGHVSSAARTIALLASEDAAIAALTIRPIKSQGGRGSGERDFSAAATILPAQSGRSVTASETYDGSCLSVTRIATDKNALMNSLASASLAFAAPLAITAQVMLPLGEARLAATEQNNETAAKKSAVRRREALEKPAVIIRKQLRVAASGLYEFFEIPCLRHRSFDASGWVRPRLSKASRFRSISSNKVLQPGFAR